MKWRAKGLGLIALAAVTLACVALFAASGVLNVSASGKYTGTGSVPAGITRIFKWIGLQSRELSAKASDPSALTINSDIHFGTVSPGMTRQGEFDVLLGDIDGEGPGRVEYHLVLSEVSGHLDLTPYLTIVRHSAESDIESDNPASASVDASFDDTSDRWLVTLSLPRNVVLGDYWTTFTVTVDQPYP